MEIRSPETLKSLMGKLSVRDLAKMTGLGHAIVGHLRSGARTTCTTRTAELICSALGVKIDALFVPEAPKPKVISMPARAAATPIAAAA